MLVDYRFWREKFKPDVIEWLYVAMAPPLPPTSKTHFYNPKPKIWHNRSLSHRIREVLYPTIEFSNKEEFLKRFKADVCFLIDVIDERVKPTEQRLREAKDSFFNRLEELNVKKKKIILISQGVYNIYDEELRKDGYNVINTEVIPFYEFNKKLRQLLEENGWHFGII